MAQSWVVRLRRGAAVDAAARARQRILAQGVVGIGSTMMVICPLACAVQANWYSGGLLERQPEALARASSASGRRSAARRQVPQHQHIADAERQADVVRQDVDLVARHAPRPGPLRNLEELVAARRCRSARGRPTRAPRRRRAATITSTSERGAHGLTLRAGSSDRARNRRAVPIRHQRAQPAAAIDQIREGGVRRRCSRCRRPSSRR